MVEAHSTSLAWIRALFSAGKSRAMSPPRTGGERVAFVHALCDFSANGCVLQTDRHVSRRVGGPIEQFHPARAHVEVCPKQFPSPERFIVAVFLSHVRLDNGDITGCDNFFLSGFVPESSLS